MVSFTCDWHFLKSRYVERRSLQKSFWATRNPQDLKSTASVCKSSALSEPTTIMSDLFFDEENNTLTSDENNPPPKAQQNLDKQQGADNTTLKGDTDS
jgi:hypothetical protein